MGRADMHKSTKSLLIHYRTCWNMTLKVDFIARLSVRLSQLLLCQQWKAMCSRLGCDLKRADQQQPESYLTLDKSRRICPVIVLPQGWKWRVWDAEIKKLYGKNWHQYLWLLLLVTFNKNCSILIEMFWNPSKNRGHGKIRNWNNVKIKTALFAVNSKLLSLHVLNQRV